MRLEGPLPGFEPCPRWAPPDGAELEELAALCNTTVPEYDPSETEFMGDAMYVSIPNAEIGYYRFGNSSSTRPAIILVAGFGSTQRSWPLRFLETLALEHEVITFDNRGQGISTVGAFLFEACHCARTCSSRALPSRSWTQGFRDSWRSSPHAPHMQPLPRTPIPRSPSPS